MPLRILLLAVLCVFGAALASVACGSGGSTDESAAETDTPRSQREFRQASIMQQSDDRAAEDPQAGDLEVEDGQADDGQAERGTIASGHRFGLPFARNVVGDPDAPVLIVEYSDFQ